MVRSTAAEPVVGLGAWGREQRGVAGGYVTVRGRPAFENSFWCGTCALLFRRMDGADGYLPPAELRERLRGGPAGVDPEVVAAFTGLLSPGEYLPMLLEVTPELVRPGDEGDYFSHEQLDTWDVAQDPGELPVDPGTPYYRLDGREPRVVRGLPGTGGPAEGLLFEFVVPMQPPDGNRGGTTEGYVQDIEAGGTPTAVAVSVLDGAYPAVWGERPPVVAAVHYGLVHFLLDGHHKVEAAARAGRTVRLLSLLALSGGNTSAEFAGTVPGLLGADRAR